MFFRQLQKLIFISIWFLPFHLLAQSGDTAVPSKPLPYAKIRAIHIEGNKKTKEFVILRELTFKPGDSIPPEKLMAVLEKNRMNIINLKIFNNAIVNVKNWQNDSLDVDITVVERWYINPLPIFKLADRNLNEWWVDRGHSFKRIQYGATLQWDNFRGRNERLRVTGSLGFAQMLDVYYKMPRIFNNDKLGVIWYGNYSRAKRMPYTALGDKLIFHYDDDIVKNQFEFGSRLMIRNKIHVSEYVEIKGGQRKVGQIIADLNPDYFLDGRTKINYVQLSVGIEADFRNLRAYPTKGWYAKAEFVNYGLGLQENVNFTSLTAAISKYFTFDKKDKHVTAHMVKAMVSFPDRQAYNIQRGLGYLQDFIRGYEYYVLDGQQYMLLKNEYKYKIISFRMKEMKVMRKSMMGNVPFSLYAKAYFDAGYVRDDFYNSGNYLRNQWLYGWGFGLDIATYNDRLVRIEYSFNKKLQNGLYLHFELPL